MNGMHGAMLQPEFTSDARPGNPFATRYTRPGAIPPLDRHGIPLDVATLASRFDAVTAAGAACCICTYLVLVTARYWVTGTLTACCTYCVTGCMQSRGQPVQGSISLEGL